MRSLARSVCRLGGDDGPLVIVSSHSDPLRSNFVHARRIDDRGEEFGEDVHGYPGVTVDLRPEAGWVVQVDFCDGAEIARRAFRGARPASAVEEIAIEWMQQCNEAPTECPECGCDDDHDPEALCGMLWAALGKGTR